MRLGGHVSPTAVMNVGYGGTDQRVVYGISGITNKLFYYKATNTRCSRLPSIEITSNLKL